MRPSSDQARAGMTLVSLSTVEVTLAQEAGKSVKRAVLDAPLRAVQYHHARGGAIRQRMAGNQLRREGVVVIPEKEARLRAVQGLTQKAPRITREP